LKPDIFQVKPGIVIEAFDDGGLILRVKDRNLIEVNETALQVLRLTDGMRTISEIAALLAEKYDIAFEEAMKDLRDLYQSLSEQEIVEQVDHHFSDNLQDGEANE
jgi:hypothetical protein